MKIWLNVPRDFLERMAVSDAIEDGDDDVQPRRQGGMVAPQALDHPRALLRHHLERPDDEYHGCEDQQ